MKIMFSRKYVSDTINSSDLFDAYYYMAQFPIDWTKIDPVQHFIDVGSRYLISPSVEFDLARYVSMYPDSVSDFPNPLFEYLVKGYREGRERFSVYQYVSIETVHSEQRNYYIKPFIQKLKSSVITVFAFHSFGKDITPSIVHYMDELYKISDAIILVADKYLPYQELIKISDMLIGWNCQFHDRGVRESWLRGIEMADQYNLLEDASSLILCDNSLLGPLFNLEDAIPFVRKRKMGTNFWSYVPCRGKINDHAHFNILKHPLLKKDRLSSLLSDQVPPDDALRVSGIRHGMLLTPLPLFIDNPGACLDIPLETNQFADMPPGEAELVALENFEAERCTVMDTNHGFTNILAEEFPGSTLMSLTICLDIGGHPDAALEVAASVLDQNYPDFELILINANPVCDIQNDLDYRFSDAVSKNRLRMLSCGEPDNLLAVAAAVARGKWILHLDSRHALAPGSLARLSAHLSQVAGHAVRLPSWKGDPNGLAGVIHRRERLIDFKSNCASWRWEHDFLKSLEFIPSLRDPQLVPSKIGSSHANPKLALHISRNTYSLAALPKVTTVITCFEQGQFIDEAIRSALMQRGHFLHEIIIADDGSRDHSRHIIAAYARRYPDLIRNLSSENRTGQAVRLRECIGEANGNFICILDGDDVWISDNKIQAQLDFLSKFPEAQLCFSGCLLMNQDGMDYAPATSSGLRNIFTLSQVLSGPNPLITLSAVIGNAAIFKALPRYLDFPWLTEYAVCAWFSHYGDMGYNFYKHVMHRLPGGNMTFKEPQDSLLASLITIRNAMSAAASKNQGPFLNAINRLEKSLQDEARLQTGRQERNRILQLAYPGMFSEAPMEDA